MKKYIPILSDNILIKMFENGDNDAFGKIVERYSRPISGVLFKILQDPMLVEDILQDTFIKAMDAIRKKRYTEEDHCKAWLLRIAHNLAIDFIRKQKKMPSAFSISTTDDFEEGGNKNYFPITDIYSESQEEKIINKETKYNIQDLVDLLPPDQKEVVILRYFHGFAFEEIATFTDVSINTALGRMRYALINLRKMISDFKSST